jgi:hypothetical protein
MANGEDFLRNFVCTAGFREGDAGLQNSDITASVAYRTDFETAYFRLKPSCYFIFLL